MSTKTWTTSADFDTWFKLNVTDAAVADQLQLLPPSSPGPMPVFRAPLSAQNQIAYVDTNTNAIIGRYQVQPTNSSGVASNPQTVWVDLYGNAWVGNELACTPPFPTLTGGAITKIGIVIGGTRCDNTVGFPANPNGLYLKPPFTYNSGVADRDGDGLIRTFNPAVDTSPLPWNNVTDLSGGTDAHVQDSVDDFILLYQRTTGAFTFGVCTNPGSPGEDVWVGTDSNGTIPGNAAHQVDVLDNYTGGINSTISPSLFGVGSAARGGWCNVIDANGVLWSSSRAIGLVRFPLPTGPGTVVAIQNPGQSLSTPICIDRNGKIWAAQLTNPGSNCDVWRFDSAGNLDAGFPKQVDTLAGAGLGSAVGICCRYQDNSIWVVFGRRLYKLDNTGAVIGSILAAPGQSFSASDIDSFGRPWLLSGPVLAGGSSASLFRVNPTTIVIDATVPLSATLSTQTWNNGFTGNARLGSSIPQGFGDVVYDSGSPQSFGVLSWNASVPVGCSLKIEYRVALTELGLVSIPFNTATSGATFSAFGQFIEIRATFQSDGQGSTQTPVLFDISLANAVSTQTHVSQSMLEGFARLFLQPAQLSPLPHAAVSQSMLEMFFDKSIAAHVSQSVLEGFYDTITKSAHVSQSLLEMFIDQGSQTIPLDSCLVAQAAVAACERTSAATCSVRGAAARGGLERGRAAVGGVVAVGCAVAAVERSGSTCQ